MPSASASTTTSSSSAATRSSASRSSRARPGTRGSTSRCASCSSTRRSPELAAVAGTQARARAEQGRLEGDVPLTPDPAVVLRRRIRSNRTTSTRRLLRGDARPGSTPRCSAEALSRLLAHHDALRLRFRTEDGGWRQFYQRRRRAAAIHAGRPHRDCRARTCAREIEGRHGRRAGEPRPGGRAALPCRVVRPRCRTGPPAVRRSTTWPSTASPGASCIEDLVARLRAPRPGAGRDAARRRPRRSASGRRACASYADESPGADEVRVLAA